MAMTFAIDRFRCLGEVEPDLRRGGKLFKRAAEGLDRQPAIVAAAAEVLEDRFAADSNPIIGRVNCEAFAQVLDFENPYSAP